MLFLPQLVCISYERWDEGSQRIQHLFQGIPQLSMLFFEPAQPLLSRLRRPSEGECVAEGVTAYTLPHAIPPTEEARMRLVQRSRKNAAYIQKILHQQGFESPVLWLRSPDQVGLMFELHLSHVVYDCDRSWAELPPEWEDVLVREAGLVLTAGPYLHDRFRMLSDNAVLLPNGADYSLFHHAGQHYETFPADLQKLSDKGYVIGYLGDVGDFTQLSPVIHAADAHPEWSFVFVGSVAKNNPSLRICRQYDNIHFLGEKVPHTLERYLAGFDLCISLADDKNPDPAVCSQQLYCYLFSGKPIIAMAGSQLEVNYPDVVLYAHNNGEFLSCCELALEQEAGLAAAQRMTYAKESTWEHRRQQLRQLLRTNGLS